jgi:predicted nuclease of restriction endonuclease-like (RecB) superfamily
VSKALLPSDYADFLTDLKARIASARLSAARAVNRDLILLYWDIGGAIVEKQRQLGWGESVVEMLAQDLRAAFPDTTGFSARNLRSMKQFHSAYSDPAIWLQVAAKLPDRAGGGAGEIWPQAVANIGKRALAVGASVPDDFLRQLVAEIPWGHHLLILNKVEGPAGRLYYLRSTARFGWSRNVLLNQIKAGAYERALREKKTHNFPLALPEHFAEQADEMLKSRYSLEFLGIGRPVSERELEDRLIGRLQAFLLELGYGFCFVGRQYRLALGQKEYFVDLLFYHRFLRALVAIDLKIGSFEPEHAGKMDFYLNLLNAKERGPDDQPAIGIILCAEKDDVEVEFALKTKANPIGVAEYQLQPRLPAEFRGKLPTARQLSNVLRLSIPSLKKATSAP